MEIVFGVTPSVYVKVYGAVPVNVKVTVGKLPEHADPPPEPDAVGSGFTVTLAEPPKVVAEQVVASLSAVTW